MLAATVGYAAFTGVSTFQLHLEDARREWRIQFNILVPPALWMPLKFPILEVPRANLCYRVAMVFVAKAIGQAA